IDPLRFKQILSNLSNNAIKFTDQGQITVRINVEENRQQRLVLHVAIIDTGIGIDEQSKQQLFTPFTQGNSTKRQGGSGLGLYICKTLISMMGGDIQLVSQLGIGTEIRFQLNVPRLATIEQQTVEATVSQPSQQRILSVLVAEDNPASRLLISQQLNFLGHQVTQAENGQQACQYLTNQQYDLLITDCN